MPRSFIRFKKLEFAVDARIDHRRILEPIAQCLVEEGEARLHQAPFSVDFVPVIHEVEMRVVSIASLM